MLSFCEGYSYTIKIIDVTCSKIDFLIWKLSLQMNFYLHLINNKVQVIDGINLSLFVSR